MKCWQRNMGLEVNKVRYHSEWPLVRLKEICNRISDGTHFTPEYVKSGIPFISVKDIYNNIVHFDKCKYITNNAHKELIKRCHPEKDDILITKSGTIGRMALVPEKPEFSLFVSVALIKSKKELIHSKFLKLCLENFLNSINISQDIKGGLLKNFHLEDIRETLIPVVSLGEQDEITSKIEELFSELDKGIENLRTTQQQLKTYRQAVLKWAFEGKLTNENVKDYELPKGWKWIRFGELFSESPQNGLYKSSTEYGSGTPIIRIDGFYNGSILDDYQYKRVRLTDEEVGRYLISVGDILVNRVNSMPYLGKCTIVKHLKESTVFESNIMKVKVEKKIALPEYLTMYLSSKKGTTELRKNAKQAVNQASINQTDVSNALVPLPIIVEQHKIVQAIESRLSVADKIEESITQSLQQAEALRQSILKNAFEGKLV